MQNPISCIIGERGAGKSVFAVYLCTEYAKQNIKCLTNFTTYGLPNTVNKSFTWIKANLDSLFDCVIFLDEAHTGIDAYEFLHNSVKHMTDFITQIRKRNVTLYVITQRFQTLAKRLRDQVNYQIEVHPTETPGMPTVMIFDLSQPYGQDFVNEFSFDGRPMFSHYNTNEIIMDETNDKPKEENKTTSKKKEVKPNVTKTDEVV